MGIGKVKIKIPWTQIKELAGSLLAKGVDRDAIPDIIGEGLDELIDFDALLNGQLEPVGDGLELIDGMVFKAAARFILSVVPEKNLIAAAQEAV